MEDTINIFIEKFKDQLENSNVEVTPETDFVNAEFWDSLTAMAEMSMIDEDYGVTIEPEEFVEFKNIQGLFDFIVNKK